VPSERQIAANRRNACYSTGPCSNAGKKRASRNSYRYGFSGTVPSSSERAKRIEKLARNIAGGTTDPLILECARVFAQAEFDLARIRRVKVALIERMQMFGEFGASSPPTSTRQTWQFLNELVEAGRFAEPVEPAATMPLGEPERSAEAVRRALPELLKLGRYERHAAALRDRSARIILDRKIRANNQK